MGLAGAGWMLALAVAAGAAEQEKATEAASPSLPLRARLSDDAIRTAVREALDGAAEPARRHEADTIRGNKYQEFAEQFSEAKVPDCLHPDALKRQPPTIGPITFTGLYAVPFVVLAKIRGKCL